MPTLEDNVAEGPVGSLNDDSADPVGYLLDDDFEDTASSDSDAGSALSYASEDNALLSSYFFQPWSDQPYHMAALKQRCENQLGRLMSPHGAQELKVLIDQILNTPADYINEIRALLRFLTAASSQHMSSSSSASLDYLLQLVDDCNMVKVACSAAVMSEDCKRQDPQTLAEVIQLALQLYMVLIRKQKPMNTKLDLVWAARSVDNMVKRFLPSTLGRSDPPVIAVDLLQIRIFLKRIKRALAIRDRVAGVGGDTNAPDMDNITQLRLTMPMRELTTIDYPGRLSRFGRRHDNDCVNVDQIEIMPTLGEIMAERPPYLPLIDHDTWHEDGVRGLAERHFRLMRQDIMQPIIRMIRCALKVEGTKREMFDDYRVYEGCHVTGVSLHYDHVSVLVRRVTFLPTVPGNCWALFNKSQTKVFFFEHYFTRSKIAPLMSRSVFQDDENENEKAPIAPLTLKLIAVRDSTLKSFMTEFDLGLMSDVLAVRLDGVLPGTFLSTLKFWHKPRSLAFESLVVPSDNFEPVTIQPPQYTRCPSFRYDLRATTKDGKSFFYKPGQPFDMEAYISCSKLDPSQVKALIRGLSHSFAVLQGPPGTGKSYTSAALLKTLLDSGVADDGPIVCVAYTNHAIDQVLLRLMQNGVSARSICRLGSNTSLAGVNRFERDHVYWRSPFHGEIMGHLEDLKRHISNYKSSVELKMEAIRRLQRTDDSPNEEWQEAKAGQRKQSVGVKRWVETALRIRAEMTASLMIKVLDARKEEIPHHDKAKSFQLESRQIVGLTTSGMANMYGMIQALQPRVMIIEEAAEISEAQSLMCLFPSLQHVLINGDHQQLRPLIRDWNLTSSSTMGHDVALDISLMERLVSPPPMLSVARILPYDQLQTQRRMTPCISELIRQYVYPSLKDGDNVLSHPMVPGMPHRLFWLNHRHYEQHVSQAPYNQYEIDMVKALVAHLIRSGTAAKDIAVITSYRLQCELLQDVISTDDPDKSKLLSSRVSQQKRMIQKRAEHDLSTKARVTSASIRIVTIDEFQGCEADVVIVSLVRSNHKKLCGFMKVINRVNVLLSRARNAMYIIGDAATMRRSPMLAGVIDHLGTSNLIGEALPISCTRHPDQATFVQRPEDVRCAAECGTISQCGHRCKISCSTGHTCRTACCEPCERKLKHCSHPCPKPCGQACPVVCPGDPPADAKLKCNHPLPASMTCGKYHEQLVDSDAKSECCVGVFSDRPDCSHQFYSLCRDVGKAMPPCAIKIVRQCRECGDSAVVPCHRRQTAPCTKPLGEKRPCGHQRRCFDGGNPRCAVLVEAGEEDGATVWLRCSDHEDARNRQVPISKALRVAQQKQPCCPLPGLELNTVVGESHHEQKLCDRLVVVDMSTCHHEVVLPCRSLETLTPDKCQVEVAMPGCDHRMHLPCGSAADLEGSICTAQVSVSYACGHEGLTLCHAQRATSDRATQNDCQHIFFVPPCGHPATVGCQEDPAKYRCMQTVSITRPGCPHPVEQICSQKQPLPPCHELRMVPGCVCPHRTGLFPCSDGTKVPPCKVEVERTLPCEHKAMMPCYNPPSTFKCSTLVDIRLPCDHVVKGACHLARGLKIDRGHDNEVTCWSRTALMAKPTKFERFNLKPHMKLNWRQKFAEPEQADPYACFTLVSVKLRCGHIATVPCHESKGQNISCKFDVRVEKSCGHVMNVKCAEVDEILSKPCTHPVEKRAGGESVEIPCHMLAQLNRPLVATDRSDRQFSDFVTQRCYAAMP